MNTKQYSRVLKPIQVGKFLLKNRIFFAPMGIDISHDDGCFSQEMYDFYCSIIDGGCGMVILGNASIHESTRLQEKGLALHNIKHAKAISPLINYGNSKNCPVVIQLQHYGSQGDCARSGGLLISPSGIPCQRMIKKTLYIMLFL